MREYQKNCSVLPWLNLELAELPRWKCQLVPFTLLVDCKWRCSQQWAMIHSAKCLLVQVPYTYRKMLDSYTGNAANIMAEFCAQWQPSLSNKNSSQKYLTPPQPGNDQMQSNFCSNMSISRSAHCFSTLWCTTAFRKAPHVRIARHR